MANYREEFKKFLEEHQSAPKTADEVSDLLLRMVAHFTEINSELSDAENKYYVKCAELVNQEDERTGKPVAIGKSEIESKATGEYTAVNELRKNLVNVEQIINALKAKIRGVTNEFNHLSNT
jgi:phage shock protein A